MSDKLGDWLLLGTCHTGAASYRCQVCGREVNLWIIEGEKPEKCSHGSKQGSWPKDDIRRAFVAGAKWWEHHETGATMWQRDRNLAEEEATKRYGERGEKS